MHFILEKEHMKLTVEEARLDEIFSDTVRIPKAFRQGIPNGSVILLRHGSEKHYATVRGLDDARQVILIDEFMRGKLGLKLSDSFDTSNMKKAGVWGHMHWYYTASNPAVRVPARIAVISMALGVISILLGVWSVWLTLWTNGG